MALILTRIEPREWQRLRDIRLSALAESPEMFGSTLAREQAFDEDEWRRRAARPATFVASRDGVDVGMAGLYEFDTAWCVMGMWVAPGARGTGVMDDNPRGMRAYARVGFRLTGASEHVREGRNELLMAKTLSDPR